MANRKFRGDIELRGKTKGVKGAFNKTGRAVDGLKSKFKGLAVAAGAVAVGAIFIGTANKIRVFEKSLSDLSAITGATGKDLDRLERASKRIGQTTTLSASQAAEAFKLMASAKPDLLENLDALEATTEAAVTLAEAAGIELPLAAEALGESLNQFGKGAEEAERFINILAAGSKFGASAIEDTSLALKNAGVVAKLAGLSFEETNAAIQAFAFAGVKGSEAGTKLRSVLIKLQTQANDEFNPAVVGMNQALDNLADANLNTSQMVELFGEKQVVSAQILLDQRDNFDALEEKLTGTSTAYEQARTRTDNLDGSIKRLGSAFEAIQLSFSSSSGAMRIVVDALADIANALAALNSGDDDGGISVTSALFEGLALSFKTVFVAGNVLKNMFDNILEVLSFVAKSIVNIISLDFDLLDDNLRELRDNINKNEREIGEFAARVFSPETAAELDANMEKFYSEPIINKAIETAQAVADLDGPDTAGEAAAKALAAKKLEQLDADLERIRVGHLSEQEALQEDLAAKLEILQEGLDQERITRAEFDEQVVAAAQEVADRITKIQKDAAKKDLTFASMTAQAKTKAIIGQVIQTTQGVATHSKTMFRINKAAAIANAVVNTAQGITKALSAYPPPISFAMAALQAAAGIAQISAIKSTSFSGGGIGTTPSAAGTSPTINDIPVGGAGGALEIPGGGDVGQAGAGQRIDINIEGLSDGGLMSTSSVRELIESIGEELGEGVSLNVSGSDNQGGEL